MANQLEYSWGPHTFSKPSQQLGNTPGAITTPLTESTYTEETVARLLPMIPAGYMADPADIAAAVAYLGSPDARYVNGETLVVDGGYVCGGMMQTGSLDLGTKSSS